MASMNDTNTTPLSPAVQDYLRAIYQINDGNEGNGRATTSQLAERLDVRPASVTAMLQRMAAAEPALVDYHKSHGARLTADGRRAALGVVRCHRLLEQYLHEKLGFGWDEVHDEADRLEHVLTEELTSRIEHVLGYPTHDPHGHAIPAADLKLDMTPAVPLSRLTEGDTAEIRFVSDDNAEFLRLLADIGLLPGKHVEVRQMDLLGNRIRVSVQGADPVSLASAVTEHVFVVVK